MLGPLFPKMYEPVPIVLKIIMTKSARLSGSEPALYAEKLITGGVNKSWSVNHKQADVTWGALRPAGLKILDKRLAVAG